MAEVPCASPRDDTAPLLFHLEPHVVREVQKRGCDLGFAESCVDLGFLAQHGESHNPSDVRAMYEKGCAGGGLMACLGLASLERGVPGTPESREREQQKIKSFCDLGHGEACFVYGLNDYAGEGPDYIEKGCMLGYAPACGPAAYAHYTNGDAAMAVPLLTRGCEGETSMSCRMLADYVRKGEGVKKDPERALRLYEKACRIPCPEASHHRACTDAGLMLMEGKGVRKDRARAIGLLRQSCPTSPDAGRACSALTKLRVSP